MTISVPAYSQNDLRWRFKRVGFSNERFGKVPFISDGVGCTTTALAALLSVFGYQTQPDQTCDVLKGVKGYLGPLIIWQAVTRAFPNAKFVGRYRSYTVSDNTKVLSYIKRGTPVMVEVITPRVKHWVLFLGNKKMLDPWDGKIKPTSTYKPIGYALFDKL